MNLKSGWGRGIICNPSCFKEWYSYLGNETIADAMMDRLIHTAHKIELSGPSMRELLANQ